MKFEEFKEELEYRMKKNVGTDEEIHISTVCKNNGIKLTAISIMEKESNISPTIYIDEYYRRFLMGMEMEEIVEDIIGLHRTYQCNRAFDIALFEDFKRAKKRICYRLVHFERNRELLKEVPYVPYLDLAIVFYCMVDTEDFGRASIIIHNSHLEMWGITKEILIKCARENTPQILAYDLRSMKDILKKFLSEEIYHEQVELQRQPNMYVLSNSYNFYGAAAILYPGLLKDFATACGSDLVILPSSIHEVIILPTDSLEDMEELSEMVRDVNENQVDAQEILADHAYYYHRGRDEVVVV